MTIATAQGDHKATLLMVLFSFTDGGEWMGDNGNPRLP